MLPWHGTQPRSYKQKLWDQRCSSRTVFSFSTNIGESKETDALSTYFGENCSARFGCAVSENGRWLSRQWKIGCCSGTVRIEVYGRFGNFFAFFLITNYRRRVVCFLFQIHLDLTCVLSLENLYSTSVCLGRCLLRVASWLLPDQCQAFLYKELKRHPLNVVPKVGTYYYVLNVAPTRKLSVAPTKKQQQTNNQKRHSLMIGLFLFSIKN